MTLALYSLKIPGTNRLSLPLPSDLFCELMEKGRRIRRLRERGRGEGVEGDIPEELVLG